MSFQRFSPAAKEAVFYAVFEAKQRGQTIITPDDFVIGVLRQMTMDLLSKFNPRDIVGLVNRIRETLPHSTPITKTDIPLSETAKSMVLNLNQSTLEITPVRIFLEAFPLLSQRVRTLLEKFGITEESIRDFEQ